MSQENTPPDIDIDIDAILAEDASSPIVPPPAKVLGFTVPEGARRVKVIDEKGNTKWRKLHEVIPSDVACTTQDGKPQFMVKELGRPQKQDLHEIMPPPNKNVGDLLKIKAAQMRNDAIIAAAESGPDSPELLGEVMKGMAEEIASLRFERMQAERDGQETSTISMRRIQGLRAVGDQWIKRKEQLSSRAIDLESPEFNSLLGFICEAFQSSMDEAGISPEMGNSVFGIFSKKLDEETWKNDAKRRMKGSQ